MFVGGNFGILDRETKKNRGLGEPVSLPWLKPLGVKKHFHDESSSEDDCYKSWDDFGLTEWNALLDMFNILQLHFISHLLRFSRYQLKNRRN